jgi:hypothetical protein
MELRTHLVQGRDVGVTATSLIQFTIRVQTESRKSQGPHYGETPMQRAAMDLAPR